MDGHLADIGWCDFRIEGFRFCNNYGHARTLPSPTRVWQLRYDFPILKMEFLIIKFDMD